MTFTEMNFFELIMLVAFGISWPFAVYKTFHTKKVEGKSFIFLVFIFIGYVSGTIYKFTTNLDLVVALYLLNGSMVLAEIILTLIYNQKTRYRFTNLAFSLKRFLSAKTVLK
jgi:hypothetical protein